MRLSSPMRRLSRCSATEATVQDELAPAHLGVANGIESPQSIVGAIGSLDSPLTADAKGYRALQWHLSGMTTEFRQAFRDQVRPVMACRA